MSFTSQGRQNRNYYLHLTKEDTEAQIITGLVNSLYFCPLFIPRAVFFYDTYFFSLLSTIFLAIAFSRNESH